MLSGKDFISLTLTLIFHRRIPLLFFYMVDVIYRELLPEFSGYNSYDVARMGYLTQKEVGYISEVLTYNALIRKKNVLVDGSLRDAHWYLEYFRKLRMDFPVIKIAIMHVHAPLHTVLMRARKRAKVTGRLVPEELIVEAVQKIPESVTQLIPQVMLISTLHCDVKWLLQLFCVII